MPATLSPRPSPAASIPDDVDETVLSMAGRSVKLTHLNKVFWPERGFTKRDLLRYYASIADVLLPHLQGRAMVMKRYPNGINSGFFFMKRAPSPRPRWVKTCAIEHRSKSVIDFPVVEDAATLLWLVNLGCIDMNPWYGRCPKIDEPDYLHFDLDPTPEASFERVREAALRIRDALKALGMPSYAKTTGSRGLHVYVPIVRGPKQKRVWTFAKALARTLASRHPKLLTAEYRIDKRPQGRVVVDYNQNAWGRTLASVYSVRPKPHASVSMPVTWAEVDRGIRVDDFRLDNALARIRKLGDLWAPLLPSAQPRFALERYV